MLEQDFIREKFKEKKERLKVSFYQIVEDIKKSGYGETSESTLSRFTKGNKLDIDNLWKVCWWTGIKILDDTAVVALEEIGMVNSIKLVIENDKFLDDKGKVILAKIFEVNYNLLKENQ